MDEKVLIGIVSALIGTIGTYLVAILKHHRKDLEFKYDTDLRDKRITQYLELWKLLQDLAKYARPKQLNHEDLANLSASLRLTLGREAGPRVFKRFAVTTPHAFVSLSLRWHPFTGLRTGKG